MSQAPQSKFLKSIETHASKVLSGTLLVIDPSSGSKDSMPGFAIFKQGVLESHGEIEIPPSYPIQKRLQVLDHKIRCLLPDPATVFGMEDISGQHFSHKYLVWACGVSVAASQTPALILVPIQTWRSYARKDPDYVKSDASDAKYMGVTIVELSKKVLQK